MLPRSWATESCSCSAMTTRSSRSTVWTCSGPWRSNAEVIMATSAPASSTLAASRPVWTPVVAASEVPTRPNRIAIQRSGNRSSSEVDSTSRGTTSRLSRSRSGW